MSTTTDAVTQLEAALAEFDVERVRRDFPLLKRDLNGRKLTYLDNAATTQKPQTVIDTLREFYEMHNSNVHRGVHFVSQEATDLYEGARERVANFMNAPRPEDVIWTTGTTGGINLVANAWGRANLAAGDEILISVMEHHSNIVPWQLVAAQTGAVVKACPVDERGVLDLAAFDELLTERVKIVALAHVSNALGTINPIRELAAKAHAKGAVFLVDGAQGAPHLGVDVQALDVDFYAFSGHKIFGPTGIGALYGRKELLESMPPWLGGGDMIDRVTIERTTYNDPPLKFEAGTPNIADAIGLAAALDYLDSLGIAKVQRYEEALMVYATGALEAIPGLRIIGTAPEKTGSISLWMEGLHPHDIGTILDQEGIAIRTGHHCCQPLMDFFGVPATARPSFSLYNTREEVDTLVAGLHKVLEIFG